MHDASSCMTHISLPMLLKPMLVCYSNAWVVELWFKNLLPRSTHPEGDAKYREPSVVYKYLLHMIMLSLMYAQNEMFVSFLTSAAGHKQQPSNN